MNYYFVTATTRYGPIHFPIFTDCHSSDRYTIAQAIELDCQERGIIVCCDWTARPIFRHQFEAITGG